MKVKGKKIILVLALLAVLVVAGLLLFLFLGKDNTNPDMDVEASAESSPPGSAESSSEGSSQGSSQSVEAVPAQILEVQGVSLGHGGLCIVLPESSGIVDPNIPPGKEKQYETVDSYHNGNRTEVSLNFLNNTISMGSLNIVTLQYFPLGDTPPEQLTYTVQADLGVKKQLSYQEISDKIVYRSDDGIVVDVAFASKNNPRTGMEDYIARSQNKTLLCPVGYNLGSGDLLADGSYIYKYDWMLPAFDYVSAHVGEMIVPIHYATPYALEGLGYTLDLGAQTGQTPQLAAVTTGTQKEEIEGGHSGMYKAGVYGGERLIGDYTVLQPVYTSGAEGPANPSSFSLLQAFKKSDIERSETGIRFLRRTKPKAAEEDYYQAYTNGPFDEFSMSPLALENYIVYSDNDIVVYDFFEFSKAPSLEDQLTSLSQTQDYQQYSIKTDWVTGARQAIFGSEGGIGRFIRKSK
ncbi:MAG: hypothetical protein RSF82_06515 [Angelakisella sp.]